MNRLSVRAWVGAGLLFAALASGAPAMAQATYPARPVKVIMPFAPGGIIDVLGRLLADRMSARTGKNFIIENKPGANTIVGAQALVAAPADGYTIMFTTNSSQVLNPLLYKSLPYNPERDLEAISILSSSSILLAVPTTMPAADLKGVIEYARTKPNGLTFGSWGNGSAGHLFGALIAQKAGIKLTHVAYRGEVAALNEVVQGSLDMTWASPNGAKALIGQGKVRLVGGTGAHRNPGQPNVPTFDEQGWKEFNLGLYAAAYAPAGTPKPIIDFLQREIRAVMNEPATAQRMSQIGMIPIASTPDELRTLFRNDYGVWKSVIETAGIRVE